MRRSIRRLTILRLMIAVALIAAIFGIVSAKRRMDLCRRLASFHHTMARRYDDLAAEAEQEGDRLRGLIRQLESGSVSERMNRGRWRTSAERVAETWRRAETRTYLKFFRAYLSTMEEQASHARAMSLRHADLRGRCGDAAARPWRAFRPPTPGIASVEQWERAASHAEDQCLASMGVSPLVLCRFSAELLSVKDRRERLSTWRARAESGLRFAAYHGGLRHKYEYAARQPWLPVESDPPPP